MKAEVVRVEPDNLVCIYKKAYEVIVSPGVDGVLPTLDMEQEVFVSIDEAFLNHAGKYCIFATLEQVGGNNIVDVTEELLER